MKVFTITLAIISIIISTINIIYNEYKKNQRVKEKMPLTDKMYMGEWVVACMFPALAIVAAIELETGDFADNALCIGLCILCIAINVYEICHWDYFKQQIIVKDYGIKRLKDNKIILYENVDLLTVTGFGSVRHPYVATLYADGEKYSFVLEDEKQEENLKLHLSAEARQRTEELENKVTKADYVFGAVMVICVLAIVVNTIVAIVIEELNPYFLPAMMITIVVAVIVFIIDRIRVARNIKKILKECNVAGVSYR